MKVHLQVPEKSGSLTDSEDGALLMRTFAKSMPTIDGPPFHSEWLLEAQEPSSGVPFLESSLGKLPPELREKVFIEALRAVPMPQYETYYAPRFHHYDPKAHPEYRWHYDHSSMTPPFAQRRWPHRDNQHPSLRPALVATFPPRATPRPRSHLSLLLVCRQIYVEACPLYYSINNFEFGSAASWVQFASHLSLARLGAIGSIEFSCCEDCGDYNPKSVERALRCLALCDNLQKLKLGLAPWDAPHLDLLKRMRGLKQVDIHHAQNWQQDSPRHNDTFWREREELIPLLLMPKGEVSDDSTDRLPKDREGQKWPVAETLGIDFSTIKKPRCRFCCRCAHRESIE